MNLRIVLALTLGIAGVSSIGASSLSRGQERTGKKAVIVELFTSEGCSSCPPADQVLTRLVSKQPIDGAEVIGLSEHVDYWNHLGWADPFSSPLFTARQARYEKTFGLNGSYTPQMVVDGDAEFVGSDDERAAQEIAKALRHQKAKLDLMVSGVDSATLTLHIHVSGSPATTGVFVAVTEDDLQSHVRRGENSGRSLSHTAVVRELFKVGDIHRGKQASLTVPIKVRPEWMRKHLKLVVFLQGGGQGGIRGASLVRLN